MPMDNNVQITADTSNAVQAIEKFGAAIEALDKKVAQLVNAGAPVDKTADAAAKAAQKMGEVQKKATNASGGISNFSKSFTELNSKISLFRQGAGALGGIFSSFVRIGKKIDQVHQSAAALSKYGLGEGMLAALRMDTGDVVDQLTLATESAKLFKSGVVTSLQEVGDAYKWAIARGREVGVGAAEAIGMVTDALVRGSERSLADLGVQLDSTGSKIEKTGEILKMIRTEVKLFQEDFRIAPEDWGERVAELKNKLLDTVSGFKLLSAGFDATKAAVSAVASSMKKDTEEIWDEIYESGSVGLQKLISDYTRTQQVLGEAIARGDRTAEQAARDRLARLATDARQFYATFENLRQKFDSGGAGLPAYVEETVQSVATAAEISRTSFQDIQAAMDATEEKSQRWAAARKKSLEEWSRRMVEAQKRLLELEAENEKLKQERESKAVRKFGGDAAYEKQKAVLQEIRSTHKWLELAGENIARYGKEYQLFSENKLQLAQRYNGLVAQEAKAVLEEVGAVRKIVEERRKLGVAVVAELGQEKAVLEARDKYLDLLRKQSGVAKKLGDIQRAAALDAEREKLAKLDTLQAILEYFSKLGAVEKPKAKKPEKQAAPDQDQVRLRELRAQAEVLRRYGLDLKNELLEEMRMLEEVVAAKSKKLRDEIKLRYRAEQEAAEQWREIQAGAEREERDILDRRFRAIQFFGYQTRDEIKKLVEQYEAARDSGREGFGAALGFLQKLEEQQVRLQKMAEARDAYEAAKQSAVYKQYASEEIRLKLGRLELELQDAIIKKQDERVAALQREGAALLQAADAEGRIAEQKRYQAQLAELQLKKMDKQIEKYQAVTRVGEAAAGAVGQALFADQEALEKYHGSRLKMIKDVFRQQMLSIAQSETVEALRSGAHALGASFFAPAAAPALWAAAAQHAAVAALAASLAGGMGAFKKSGKSGASGGSAPAPPAPQGAQKSEEQKIEIVIRGRDGWESALVEAVQTAQSRGKARRW